MELLWIGGWECIYFKVCLSKKSFSLDEEVCFGLCCLGSVYG